MQRFYDRLDSLVTFVLLFLVVAMVASITAEIVLNAAIQPAVSSLLKVLETDSQPSALTNWLHGIMSFIANASAPVNTASQTLLVWIGILGSALAFRQRSHLGVDALVRVYPPKVRLALDYLSTFLVGVFSLLVFTIGGYLVCQRAFSMGSKMPGFEAFNWGWFYLVLVMAGVLNLIYCVYHFCHPEAAGFTGDEKE